MINVTWEEKINPDGESKVSPGLRNPTPPHTLPRGKEIENETHVNEV